MPILAIEFSEVDYLRVRLGAADPMWDTLLSLRVLQAQQGLSSRLRQWQSVAGHEVSKRMPSGRVRDLLAITSGAAGLPKFLIADGTGPIAAHLSQIAAMDPREVATQVADIRPWTPAVAQLHAAFADDGEAALRRLTDALGDYHDVVCPVLVQHREADLKIDEKHRLALLSDGGVEMVLASFDTSVAVCEPPVLKIRHHADSTALLGGRGITLRPSWFCCGRAEVSIDTSRSPVLVHPLSVSASQDRRARSTRSLDSLLGRTRTLILMACDGRSSSDVAQRLGLSASTVSEHLSVLRDAGLIVTSRDRTRARHSWTNSAQDLLLRAGTTR